MGHVRSTWAASLCKWTGRGPIHAAILKWLFQNFLQKYPWKIEVFYFDTEVTRAEKAALQSFYSLCTNFI